jgi:hypothetical protein
MAKMGGKLVIEKNSSMLEEFQGWEDRIKREHLEWVVFSLAMDMDLTYKFNSTVERVRRQHMRDMAEQQRRELCAE